MSEIPIFCKHNWKLLCGNYGQPVNCMVKECKRCGADWFEKVRGKNVLKNRYWPPEPKRQIGYMEKEKKQ